MIQTLPPPLRRVLQRRTADGLTLRRVDLRSRGLDLGVRIVLVSDLHARPDWFPRAEVAKVVDAINRIEGADLVALVGDFVGNDLDSITWSAEEYARITAPAAAVLGNHDHWLDARHIEATLEAAGVRVYTNRAAPLDTLVPAARSDTWIVGIDSCWPRRGSTGPGARPDDAFREVPPGADTLVLGHEPHLATMHEHVLHLAGHTHCGQVRTPGIGDWTARLHMPKFSEPFPNRLYELPVEPTGSLPPERRTARDRRWVYTTAGVGYSTVDLRMFCPPELVVIDA